MAPTDTETRRDATAAPASVYVHVPFCAVKCGYCDFNSYVVEDGGVHDRFLAALDAELRISTLPTEPVSVFLGGGTPTYLSSARFRELFVVLSRHLDLRQCAEVSIEANPESLTPEKVQIAAEAGVSRFSMGVQSFDAAVLRFLDRAHSGERAIEAFGELRSGGASNVSIDLIYGSPGQSFEAWEQDLGIALGLGPDHLSCYNLTYEPGTRLTKALEQGRVERNDEELDRSMFVHTRQRLLDSGFDAYEISNFAGRGGICRHNDHYWLQGDYVGVGPGASSHRAGCRWTNLKPVEAWADSALDGVPPVASAETLSPIRRAGEAMWLGIRRRDGVDLEQIGLRVGLDLQQTFADELEEHHRRGWIHRVGSRVHLTDAGILLADHVGAAYLQ
jgi:oxygen-independent coproporphyrinogen-3 oxidase